ncbi:MAG: PTS sugar transporter subunit IIA [Elusimicrobiota bacterium]
MQLSVRDVAKLLQVSEETVYDWLKKGAIPGHQVNDQYKFHRAEILEWATANNIRIAADILDEGSARTQGISEALRAGGIIYKLKGGDKKSALRSLVEALPLPQGTDRDFLFTVLAAREDLASTGIGDGIAIPHVRNPIVLQVPRPIVTLCFMEKPVDFGALDGKPVHCLFALVSPTVRGHLQLLSRLAYTLSDKGFKAVLRKQGSTEQIFAELKRVETHLKP